MSRAECYTWDFRMSVNDTQAEDLIQIMKQIAKKYVFQMEKGQLNGHLHWQGRMSLIKKAFKVKLIKLWQDSTDLPVPEYLEPTTNNQKHFDYDCYAAKADSRVGSTYTDKDEDQQDVYIPRQYRNKMDTLRPFQKTIFDSKDIFDDRIINLIYDPAGCNGKTTIAALCELLGRGIDLPPLNDSEHLIQSCCNICMGRKIRDPSPIFIDLPRAMNKDRLFGLYSAIEQIKKGKLYDVRNHYKVWWIDSPQIWVFTNTQPDKGLLSRDRWKIWQIDEDYQLIPYEENLFLD